MMLNKTILSLSMLAVAAAPAMAADEKPFDGFYLGGEIGYSDFSLDIDAGDAEVSFDDSGLVYGGFAGWRKQFNSGLVLGLEGRISKPDFDLTLTDGDDTATLSAKEQYGIDGVVGYVPPALPNTLFYGKAGYTRARARAVLTGTVNSSETDSGDAFRWGGGVEQALTQNISLRAQAIRTNYESVDGADLNDWQMTGGLIFKF